MSQVRTVAAALLLITPSMPAAYVYNTLFNGCSQVPGYCAAGELQAGGGFTISLYDNGFLARTSVFSNFDIAAFGLQSSELIIRPLNAPEFGIWSTGGAGFEVSDGNLLNGNALSTANGSAGSLFIDFDYAGPGIDSAGVTGAFGVVSSGALARATVSAGSAQASVECRGAPCLQQVLKDKDEKKFLAVPITVSLSVTLDSNVPLNPFGKQAELQSVRIAVYQTPEPATWLSVAGGLLLIRLFRR